MRSTSSLTFQFIRSSGLLWSCYSCFTITGTFLLKKKREKDREDTPIFLEGLKVELTISVHVCTFGQIVYGQPVYKGGWEISSVGGEGAKSTSHQDLGVYY